ncbi:MAG: hypothetical protein J5517_02995 [Eubacterium sp.]|nr:hypothetical protein [Eubacterium sp.]
MKEERPSPPWINEIPEGATISYDPTYPTGSFFDRFNKGSYSGMKYYFYDPTEHGYPNKEDYPLMIFLHGTGNALVGDLCINYTGAEMYASDEYQNDIGGAYILVPVANEVQDKDGNTTGFWDEDYVEPIIDLTQYFIKNHTNGIKEKILLGNSSGARFTFTIAKKHPEKFDILVPVGTSDIPDDETLDILSDLGVTLFYAICKHDEFFPYDTQVAPRIDKLRGMKNSFIFTPDWTYNGDKGIASINFGFEMGQHCLMNGVQMNLKFDDGTPMYASLPRGFTGWLSDELKRRKNIV